MQLMLRFKLGVRGQPFAFMTTAAGRCGMDHSETMTCLVSSCLATFISSYLVCFSSPRCGEEQPSAPLR